MRPGSVLFMMGTLVGYTQAFLPTTPLMPTCQQRGAMVASGRRGLQMSSIFEEEDKTGQRIRDGLLVRFLPEDITRVLASWDRMVANKPFEDKANQRYAQSYIEGLSAKPWHDLSEYVVLVECLATLGGLEVWREGGCCQDAPIGVPTSLGLLTWCCVVPIHQTPVGTGAGEERGGGAGGAEGGLEHGACPGAEW